MIEVETLPDIRPNTYYVYLHLRRDCGSVFYVGKGTGRRFKSLDGRNTHWKNIAAKCGVIARIVACNLTDNEAFVLESKLIREFGRKDLNLGPLVNMTDGYDGVRNCVFTDAHRRKLSVAGKGRNHSKQHREYMSKIMKGRVISVETRHRISQSKTGGKLSDEHRKNLCASNTTKRAVLCVDTGVVYESTQAAARAVDGCHSCISKCCLGKRVRHRGLRWCFNNASDLNSNNAA